MVNRKKTMERKSVTYQQLQRIMAEKSGCPVCHAGQQAGHLYLDGLLWESVNDPDIRGELLASLGFCGRHCRELLDFGGERLGVAIIQRAVMKEAVRQLEGTPLAPGRTLFQRLQDQLLRGGKMANRAEGGTAFEPCPACLHQSQVEERAIQGLLTYLVDDLDAPLQQVGGLCWPHLQQSLRLCDGEQSCVLLVEMHRRLWSEMIEDLGEFIRKQDHRFHGEPATEEERSSVDRSIGTLTGEYPLR
jgi:hypothetical protein